MINSLMLIGLAGLIQAVPLDTAQLDIRELNGVGLTPAMGWNNYNAGLGATGASALAAAKAFVSLGLNKIGYEYVNIDDTWSSKTRDSNGNLVADTTKWPNGIADVTAQIHALGLKFGLYGDSGTATCSGYPGSAGYETKDANQIAAWGVDYWKYDNCATPSTGNSSVRYTTMSNALKASGREILYSLCNWGDDAVYEWGGSIGNSWRVGGDIKNTWASITSIASANAGIASFAAPGGFNDFDMMEIGNGVLTAAEERSHFGIWAISKSPLILGTDLTKISATSLATISNAGVIAINQDSLGLAATYFQPKGQAAPVSGTLYPYYSGKLSDGHVVAMIAVNGAATMTVNFSDVPGLGTGSYAWKELYTGTSGTGTSVSASLVAHDMAIYKVTTGTGSSGTTTSTKTTPPSTTSTKASTTSAAPTSTGTVPEYGQCGGTGWTGGTVCVSPYTCKYSNPYYSQCL